MVRAVIGMYQRAYVGLPREIWMLSGAIFVNRCGTMVVPFFTLYLTSQLGYQEAAAGWLLSAYGLGSVVGTYVGGRLTSRLGAVRLQIVFLLMGVPACLIVPLFRSWWSIAAAVFLLSFFTEGVRPANGTAVAQYAPPHVRVRAFGLQRMAANLGISFGPAIGGVLATFSFAWLFAADALTTLLGALTLVFFFGLRGGAEEESTRHAAGAEVSVSGSPLRDHNFVIFIVLILISSIVFFQFHVTYPLFLTQHYGLTKPQIGLIYAVNTLVIVAFEMLLLNMLRRWPLIPVIGCGALLSCVGFGMLPFGQSFVYCVLSMLVITLGEMLWMPLASGWVAHRSDRGERGMYMGWYTMTFSLATIISPMMGGAIFQWDRNLVWYLSLVTGSVVGCGFYWLHGRLARELSPAVVDGETATVTTDQERLSASPLSALLPTRLSASRRHVDRSAY